MNLRAANRISKASLESQGHCNFINATNIARDKKCLDPLERNKRDIGWGVYCARFWVRKSVEQLVNMSSCMKISKPPLLGRITDLASNHEKAAVFRSRK